MRQDPTTLERFPGSFILHASLMPIAHTGHTGAEGVFRVQYLARDSLGSKWDIIAASL